MNKLFEVISKGKKRELTAFWEYLVGFLAVSVSIFEIWAILFGVIEYWVQGIIFLPTILAILFICYTPNKLSDSKKMNFIDIIIIVLLLCTIIYFYLHSARIIYRWPLIDPLTIADIFFGSSLFIIIIESVRRLLGLPLLSVILVFIIYFFIGPFMPGGLYHGGGTLLLFIDKMIFTLGGIFSAPLRVTFSLIFIFVLFGDILLRAGGSDVFLDLARAIAGKKVGGMAKIAVFSSALYGMISGNSAADVVTTGSFTIPAMKQQGYPARLAGAIEVVASSGGNLLPPIMGAAAFIMVEITGIPYREIIISATIPAILYYVGAYFAIHFRAMKINLKTDSTEHQKTVFRALIDNVHFILPVAVLLWGLLEGYTASWSAAIAIVTSVLVSWVRKNTRIGIKKLFMSFVESAKKLIVVTVATAGAGVVIGCLMHSGLSSKFTSLLLQFTFGIPFLVLLITMIVSIILGMGMPSSGAYVLASVLTVPAILEAGFQTQLQANLFVFYAATLSTITPPVAIAAFAASAIAEEEPYKISITGIRLAICAFVIPFVFMYRPSLLMMGSIANIVLSFISSVIGVIALVSFSEGWLVKKIVLVERLLLLLVVVGSFYPNFVVNVFSLIILLIIFFKQKKEILKISSSEKNIE